MDLPNQVAEVSLKYVRNASVINNKIGSAEDAVKIFRNFFDEDSIDHKEFVYVMLLSQANKVLGVSLISVGGINECVIDVRVVFQTALLSNAVGIILAHNHPSGQLNASSADIHITKKVKEAGNLLDIKLLDHVILTSTTYTSFANDGLI